MVLLFLFFLLLYGVHQFFFSRMETRTTKKSSLFAPAMKNRSVKKVDESPYYKPALKNNTLTI